MGKSRARHPEQLAAAQGRIRSAGERLTASRAAVLAVLLASDTALTHHEVEKSLPAATPVDRVTVYRVLDWLVSLGLAHRIPGEDRTWRFRANRDPAHGPHAHFTCSSCGKTVCLEDVAVPPSVRVPRGFLPRKVELTVQGLCATCH
ncbi:MAG TPA: Fur family transcriptional regulator [Usitatibacteraceae bacterium]|nr:Fur family transcriptional regulator [Usitatibacteraceae bacterium]